MNKTLPVGGVAVAVDGSEHSETTVAWAVKFARQLALPVTVVHVWEIDMPLAPYGYVAPNSPAQAEEAAEAVVEGQLAPYADGVSGCIIQGSWRDLVAASEDVTLLVVGARPHTKHRGLGHFSHMVASHAGCPVVVVPTALPSAHDTELPMTASLV